MAGITNWRAILAVPITPHRSFSIADSRLLVLSESVDYKGTNRGTGGGGLNNGFTARRARRIMESNAGSAVQAAARVSG
jgi:hypothetical protein